MLAVTTGIGLTFASLELPAVVHGALAGSLPAIGGDSHEDDASRLRTELFIRHYHLRSIGYLCFGLMVLLIVAGFAAGRAGLAIGGAAMMFLPVFAQFATTMFFLAGLGLLNLVWLPVLDLSFEIAALGDIVYLPYRLLRLMADRLGLDIHRPLVVLLTGGGLVIFISGMLSWFTARAAGRGMADAWVYRISRHPQYLGWLVWSYGMLLAALTVRYPRRSWGISGSLPWLLSAMVIIGVALLEERHMQRVFGEPYTRYRQRTPFLLPLPKVVSEAFTLPSRLLFGKRMPERAGEIAAVLVLFTVILIAASHVSLQLRAIPRLPAGDRAQTAVDAARADRYVHALRDADTWHQRAPFATALGEIGEPAVDPLVELLSDPDPELRQIAAGTLGRLGSPRAAEPLIASLSDPDESVRCRAAKALGRLRAQRAEGPLIAMLAENGGPVRLEAARALGSIGSAAAVEPLLAVLHDPRPWTRAAVVNALGQLRSERAIEPLLRLLDSDAEEAEVRRAVMVAFSQIGSPRTEEALRAALTDNDREVRIYAAEALRLLGAPGSMPP